jgi:predicted Zn-ribbon and HTH transcriptional regulator
MREADETTRERIAAHLRETTASPSSLATEFDVTAELAVEHVRHVARSLSADDEQLLVAPPECRDCGFDRFDDPANRPSRCPECKSEAIDEPTFTIGDPT